MEYTSGNQILPREYFYLAEPVKKEVTKAEFEEFINRYPRKLIRDVTGICDPPLVTYNDFELSNRWPYSVVASTSLYDDDPSGYFYLPEEERRYVITVNHQELFDSKTGNMA